MLPSASKALSAFSEAQETALALFRVGLDVGNPASHLLFGVTGSSKTVVYMKLAKEYLRCGCSMLLLAPEMALALKLRQDVSLALPDVPLYLFHGYQSAALREKTFRELTKCREPCPVVGTRSALFLSLSSPGAVVLDEEHDFSFKQDEGFTYQTKKVAWFRIAQAKGLLVLKSATPDLKMFYAVRETKIPVSTPPARVGGGMLPLIGPAGTWSMNRAESTLIPETPSAFKQTVEQGDQAVVLLNRRGYALLMYYIDCGKVARYSHCDIGLTYHEGRERLIYHYCGYSVLLPSPCPSCKGLHFYPMG